MLLRLSVFNIIFFSLIIGVYSLGMNDVNVIYLVQKKCMAFTMPSFATIHDTNTIT
jgi:hypothetical protein